MRSSPRWLSRREPEVRERYHVCLVSIRQLTSAYVSIRQHTEVRERYNICLASMRQQTQDVQSCVHNKATNLSA